MSRGAARQASALRQIAARGQAVVVRRPAHPAAFDTAPVRAIVRPAGEKDIVEGIAQAGEQVVMLSPVSLGDWPDGASELPKRGDVVVVAGSALSVTAARVVREDGVVVRVDLAVAGRVA